MKLKITMLSLVLGLCFCFGSPTMVAQCAKAKTAAVKEKAATPAAVAILDLSAIQDQLPCDPAKCKPANCDPAKCIPSDKCDPSKCPLVKNAKMAECKKAQKQCSKEKATTTKVALAAVKE
ncbi:MAG: hypothetical protein AAFO94_15050 [Bacteroidota bacterium]